MQAEQQKICTLLEALDNVSGYDGRWQLNEQSVLNTLARTRADPGSSIRHYFGHRHSSLSCLPIVTSYMTSSSNVCAADRRSGNLRLH